METCTIRSRKRNEFIDITERVQEVVARSGIRDGACLLHVPHTTAGITVNEGADPSVQGDILSFLARLVPHDGPYRHIEGNADAHIKSTIVGVSQTLPVRNGRIVLGTWQAIFFCEFDGPRSRRIHICLIPRGGS